MPSIAAELRILADSFLNWRSCPLSKLVLLLGVSYPLVPLDLIPDSTPFFGHFDEIGFVLAGFVGGRLLLPKPIRDGYIATRITRLQRAIRPGPMQNLQFLIRVARADTANFFLYQYRSADAFLITGKNSGTHWLKFMLSCALAKQHDVPPPRYASGRDADAIIGHPRWPPRHAHLPRIGSSHTIPSLAFTWPWLTRVLPFPPVVVLVRDIRAAMASHYTKWQDEYQVQLASYVRGDPLGRRYRADIWWFMHFFNRWGDLATAHHGKILIVRYEELECDPEPLLRQISEHLQIELNDSAIATAMSFLSRRAIRASLDPTDTEVVVPSDDAASAVAYGPADEEFIRNTLARYLRHGFGYGGCCGSQT